MTTSDRSGMLRHLWANAYGVGFGVLFFLAAVGSLLSDDADRSSVARATATGAADEVWSVFFGVGGFLVLVGLCQRRPNIEGAGLVCTIFGLLVAIVAVLAVVGFSSQSRFALATYTAMLVGQAARLGWLVYCSRPPQRCD